jgi:SAM-dependent methyltransferase
VLEYYGVTDTADLPATQRMWADFTLSAAERGFTAVGMLGGSYAVRGKRVLDVGCGYGGFLVAAGRAGAKEVVGIDTNPRVLELAPLLLSDYEVTARLEHLDLADQEVAERLGKFDLIICNDVLEHVPDVERAVRNLTSMLVEGGRIFLEIPNGNAVKYVRADGHYKIPGITLLDFEDARELHQQHFPEATTYDTYFYGTLDYYLAVFSRHGVTLRLLDVPIGDDGSIERLSSEIEGLRAESSQWQHSGAIGRANDYLLEVEKRLERFRALSNPSEREMIGTSLRISYEVGNWLLEGYRRAGI